MLLSCVASFVHKTVQKLGTRLHTLQKYEYNIENEGVNNCSYYIFSMKRT